MIIFVFFLSTFAVKRPVAPGGSSSSGDENPEVVQGEAVLYECSPETVYNSALTADVRASINCTGFTVFDDTVGILAEGSDWCTFSVDELTQSYALTNCTGFCALAGLTCIDAFNSTENNCGVESLSMTCDANHGHRHGCVCWDETGDFVTYWNIQDRDFLPMLIFVIAFPFFFFGISAFAWWKAESLEDQLEAPSQNKRGSMADVLQSR